MADWLARKQIGDAHEQRIIEALRSCGWTAQLCGQGTYSPVIQHALRRTDSALRQFPDILAARGTEIVAVDAKTRMPGTSGTRYAISRNSLRAGLQFLGMNAPVALYYVFGDLKVLTPAEVAHYGSIGVRHPSGSYYMVATERAHGFDEVFGMVQVAHA